MFEIVLLLLLTIYLIYIIVFQIPRNIKKMEDKIDRLSLQIKEINLKLVDIIDRENKK